MERHDLRHASWNRVFELIKQPNRDRCYALYEAHRVAMDEARGSKGKHQAWSGGYLDHVCETVGIAEKMYETLYLMRPHLGFDLSDAALVLYVHDLEKPFKHQEKDGRIIDAPGLDTKDGRKKFVLDLLGKFEIELTESQLTAFMYIEGEGSDYNPYRRVQNELGAFCQCCDTISARIWYQYPKA